MRDDDGPAVALDRQAAAQLEERFVQSYRSYAAEVRAWAERLTGRA